MNSASKAELSRRHFMQHLAVGAAAVPSLEFVSHLKANAAEVRRNQKAGILIWLGGGPPTIDMWDLKPGSQNGGEFKPIATKGDMQISELFPKTAKVMDQLSLVRSMSTREADHTRARYYLHTAYVPNPTVIHPTFGSVASFELASKHTDLEIPAFVSIGGSSGSPGYLGTTHAPFTVDSSGSIRNANTQGIKPNRVSQRLSMLAVIESGFINSKRGDLPLAHKEVYKKAVNLMQSQQMKAFRSSEENPAVREAYGNNNLGRSLLLARRLVEAGVPFVEVNFGGWDLHSNVFTTLRNQRLPMLDQGISALTSDLKQRGMLDDTALVCMGEFGRTPRINQNVGRDHWARSWSVLMGGGGMVGGRAIGKTDADGLEIIGKSYLPGDIWATVAKCMGIPLGKPHRSKLGRPMKIANGGQPIQELFG